MSDHTIANRRHVQLIVALCLFVFFNITCFTLVTSFTKSNFLTAIQTSPVFKDVYNQRPYFFLYGLSGVCFILFYLIYHMLSPRTSFEYRIKRELLFLSGASLVLYLLPVLFPGFEQRFLPAAFYFIIYDILDDLILVQTWTLINYAIDIRQSKKIQNLFLFSGGVAAVISGRGIIRLVPENNETFFLLLVLLFSGISYLIVTYIFFRHRDRIFTTFSTEKMRFKTLFTSQKKYGIIRSIIYLTVLVGIFNLFFKVLFDTQVNVRYPVAATVATASFDPLTMPDPKTEFIGQYKAFISIFQVALQLVFIYFFSRLWLNGRILLSYPLILIPILGFILGVYLARRPGFEGILFWGTIVACGANELMRRIIFDAAYQLLLFSIPEKLCNALRMYAKLLIKPWVVIVICAFFVAIPPQTSPFLIYCILIMLFLGLMTAVVLRIPNAYISSLKRSVLRRLPVERSMDSLVRLETNYIVEQYQKVVAESDDRFGYLYILNIIQNNYSPDLNAILSALLENRDIEVRLEAVSVVTELGIQKLIGRIEALFARETDPDLKKACLKAVAAWGISNEARVQEWMRMDLPIDLRKYVLAAAYRTGSAGLMEIAAQEAAALSHATDHAAILAGIWLIGELRLSHLTDGIQRHVDMEDRRAYRVILEAAAKLEDFGLFTSCIQHLGYERIVNDEVFHRSLARFGARAFEVISDMLEMIIESKTHFELKNCIRTLRHIPSQDAVDFLTDVFRRYNVPLIREEALDCVARIKTAEPNLDYHRIMENLLEEIHQCRKYCRYWRAVSSSKPESLMLIELARNIEHRIWSIFKVLNMFHSDLAIFDSYCRITQTSCQQVDASHVKAKSIEYLESLIKENYPELLTFLESITFEDGIIVDVAPLPGPRLNVMDVYEEILGQSNHWLEISAILDMPPGMRERLGSSSKETEDMIPVMEKVHFLRKVPLFRGFSIGDMMVIAQIAQEVRLEAGNVLFRKGDRGNALYLILEGEVDIVNEERRLLSKLGATRCFGEVSLLDKKGRAATAVCMNDCRMLMISSDDFEEILEKYPVLYKNIVQVLTGWLRNTPPTQERNGIKWSGS
ncbi:MAG: cyclic nucleotide-binding domain-containing protein [Deltaproteobacteria bacterium]|nr:cyclic nucleotide-binding domain-containing protein [Deltaproteobacteria bacterium]